MSLYKDASLVMIPSAYKDGKLYSIRPVEQLGDELVTNGSFDTNSDWSLGSGSTISGGSLNIVSAPYNANTKQTISLTNGTTYKISINYTAIGTATSNTFQLGFGDFSGNPTDTTQHEFEEGSGVKTLNVTAASGDATIIFRSRDAGTCDLSINSVSVKEVITANGDFTFSRGSNLAATRVASSGYIQKGRENHLLQSNQFDTTWSNVNTTETSGQSGYDGSSDAWRINLNSGTATKLITQSVTALSGVYTASFYAKAGTHSIVQIGTSTQSNIFVSFDLSDGSVGSLSANAISAKATDVGSSWYRIEVAFLSSNANGVSIAAVDSLSATRFQSTSSTGNFYIQDAQLEAGLVATDYLETGASTAQAGILEDMPRLDYSGGATCPSLKLEPQRSNLMVQSEGFSTSAWTDNKTSNTSVTANAAVSPEGLQNATEIDFTTTGGAEIYDQFSNVASSMHIGSVFLKNNDVNFVQCELTGATPDILAQVTIDLRDGTLSAQAGDYTPTIEDYGNGWWRVAFGDTANASVATPAFKLKSVGSNTGSFYAFGAQVEAGSYPTSYIPTYGASVTRSTDNALGFSYNSRILRNLLLSYRSLLLPIKANEIAEGGEQVFGFDDSSYSKLVELDYMPQTHILGY